MIICYQTQSLYNKLINPFCFLYKLTLKIIIQNYTFLKNLYILSIKYLINFVFIFYFSAKSLKLIFYRLTFFYRKPRMYLQSIYKYLQRSMSRSC